MEVLFWISFSAIFYAYLGYPLLLLMLTRWFRHPHPEPMIAEYKSDDFPSVSLILPVYNEELCIARKIENTFSLTYPQDKLEFLIVSDGSNDRTPEIVKSYQAPGLKLIELPQRGGKAAALNHGLRNSNGNIVCFSDASILLEIDALTKLISNFKDSTIGCVSGEDAIRGGGGEGLYGQYELALRRLESQAKSIVGASGSFYAQRRSLCNDFPEGLAPDFLSVLNTVEQGYRAISDPEARGYMTSLNNSKAEFQRKVRTILRGLSTLFSKTKLLNPFHFGIFSLELISHKLMRWLAPFFLIFLLISNFFLLDNKFYPLFFYTQILVYFLALLSFLKIPLFKNNRLGRFALYFTVVNMATLLAWWKYLLGERQEIWNPTRRESTHS